MKQKKKLGIIIAVAIAIIVVGVVILFALKANKSSSQKETKTDADGGKYVCRFELDICISPDFVHELLYHGAGIRVVSPEHLRREIKNVAKKILEA